MPSQIPPRFLLPVIAACSQLLLKSVSKLFENVEWSNSLQRHFKIHTLLKINCCVAAISAFRVTQHSQIFSFFFRNRIQCIVLYELHNSQALLNLRHGYFRCQEWDPTHFIVSLVPIWWIFTSSCEFLPTWKVLDQS